MSVPYNQEKIDKIKKLKKERNAIILAHNYVLGEVQDVADFVGDSLELSIKARDIDEDVIVFCGVQFMAETAKILSPEKTVLHPVKESGCPMADMATASALRKFKKDYPGAVTVCYVNSTAELKTEVDVCCTSANAADIVSLVPEDKQVLFLPDKNLGAYVAKQTGRDIVLWKGFCPTHMRLTPEDILKKKKEYPEAVTIVHPECRPEVIELSDHALSTGGMLRFAKETEEKQIIVATELGIIHRLQKENPHKLFIPISEQAVCMNMKMIELDHIINALEKNETEIVLDRETIEKARKPIVRMLEKDLSL
ncbi:quinolinate synthase NadA [Spirochaeta isovalerica]|uniref:Quinolinate synthase n=1 Tax=Spirochaeta isovalerica TaxID=150 RepID=A0A841REN2_9SPIO|nr:quinolinate synthase NadA [Spirochaeta isovalerica]MBB6481460.1 quinolinate synthase [Spirochaeta isovalerica]